MAKKIFALVATVVLVVCFAVTVSAVNVATTTTYVAGDPAMANVSVTISGVTEGNNVTYYATNDAGEVFVDQKKVDAGATSVAFNYETAHANVGSAVKVGYTGASAEEGTIPDADKYAISYEGATLTSVYPGQGATVAINYTPAPYTTVTNVEATNATVVTWSGTTEISVTLANVTGDVELSVATDVIVIPDYTETIEIVESAAVLVAASEDPYYEGGIKVDGVKPDLGEFTPDETDPEIIASANADKVGDRKLTVVGKIGAFDEFGVIVSTEAIAEENLRPAAFEAAYADKKYEAIDKAPDGKFAVQLIDVSTEAADAFVVAGTNYYTAIYAYDATAEAYYVVPYATAVAAN